jgi:hypothetical protein
VIIKERIIAGHAVDDRGGGANGGHGGAGSDSGSGDEGDDGMEDECGQAGVDAADQMLEAREQELRVRACAGVAGACVYAWEACMGLCAAAVCRSVCVPDAERQGRRWLRALLAGAADRCWWPALQAGCARARVVLSRRQ